MLDIQNVRKTFNKNTINEKKALNGINLHLDEGDFVTVIGGNGAGKSTMLNMIAGVYPIDSGKIEIDGVNISREPEYKRCLLYTSIWICKRCKGLPEAGGRRSRNKGRLERRILLL